MGEISGQSRTTSLISTLGTAFGGISSMLGIMTFSMPFSSITTSMSETGGKALKPAGVEDSVEASVCRVTVDDVDELTDNEVLVVVVDVVVAA